MCLALRVLTLSPLPGLPLVMSSDLARCGGLLVPHDGEPVGDVRDRPDRWAALQLLTQAIRRGVPVLAWGSGAALAGRALGSAVEQTDGLEWAQAPRNAEVLVWRQERPQHWQVGRVNAWASPEMPAELAAAFLSTLPAQRSRQPASPLEAVGGEAALRPLLADFYARARTDELLGPVFTSHVTDWHAHLDRVTAFWVTMLGGGPAWRGNLNAAHAGLGVSSAQLERWLTLLAQAAHAHLPAEAAEVLLTRAHAMARQLGRRGKRESAGTRRC
ncbi:group III truncated hemoglobin [Deinococcus deserti]|uniref:Putative Bacterial-like globin family protein (Truncated hemoglobins) n=2 Tax=Deinococcus TaxID=1298 RepID=C1CVK3_DEIDV|nr:putative Bacterial-like globin family protein (truncated hemoglobins) [Deinococcus deserti VCD115]